MGTLALLLPSLQIALSNSENDAKRIEGVAEYVTRNRACMHKQILVSTSNGGMLLQCKDGRIKCESAR